MTESAGKRGVRVDVMREPELCARRRELKSRWHDADDLRRVSGDDQPSANDITCARETAAPQAFTDNADIRTFGRVFGLAERAAEDRWDFEKRDDVGRRP